MRINFSTHFAPPNFLDLIAKSGLGDIADRTRGMPTAADLDARRRAMAEFPDIKQVLSATLPSVEAIALKMGTSALEVAKHLNNDLLEIQERNSDLFVATLASVPMDSTADALSHMNEMAKAGAKGFQINTNVLGKPLDSPEYRPIFAMAESLDLPIFIHPDRDAKMESYSKESSACNEEWWVFGWESELLVAQGRIVFAGIFDEFPRIKLVIHHFAGGAGMYEGRIGQGWQYGGGKRTSRDAGRVLRQKIERMRMPPLAYFHMFYADTAHMGGEAAALCGFHFHGPDKLVFGCDEPFEPQDGYFARETIRCNNFAANTLGWSDEDRTKVDWKNAAHLMKLEKL